jgi:tRNA threonylcarbamoyladenosine biosynthesis protein TsaB
MEKPIVCIETSTKACSIALFRGTELLAHRLEIPEEFRHAERLHPLLDELMKEAKLQYSELGAIAISRGPGSYTGLRIGVSAAKGLAYALDLPFIAIDTLLLLSKEAKIQMPDADFYMPMIDARRMEVYTTIYNGDLVQVNAFEAKILDNASFADHLSSGVCCFFGDGAAKSVDLLGSHPNFRYLENIHPDARHMGSLAYAKWLKNEVENLAYFEPFYLKEFVGTQSGK